MKGKALWKKLDTVKYPLLVFLAGLLLMLLPSGGAKSAPAENPDLTLEQLLAETDGVGRIRVLVSEKGAVVVCDGAEKAGVRLDILHAIRSYTGFGTDTVTVLKMKD